jgi:hypothetical protein
MVTPVGTIRSVRPVRLSTDRSRFICPENWYDRLAETGVEPGPFGRHRCEASDNRCECPSLFRIHRLNWTVLPRNATEITIGSDTDTAHRSAVEHVVVLSVISHRLPCGVIRSCVIFLIPTKQKTVSVVRNANPHRHCRNWLRTTVSVVRNSEDFEPRLRCLERDTLTMIFKQIGSTFSYSNDTFASSPITVVGPLESLPTHGRNWTGMIHTGHEKQHLAE